jgi:hypothetical protein
LVQFRCVLLDYQVFNSLKLQIFCLSQYLNFVLECNEFHSFTGIGFKPRAKRPVGRAEAAFRSNKQKCVFKKRMTSIRSTTSKLKQIIYAIKA